MTGLQAVSLFAGMEGFGLACDRAGIPVRVAIEIDPACRGVIGRHFPDTILLDDVTKVTGDQLRALGVVPGRCVLTFGWPCQDLSVAGLRAGLGGARSGLFWEAMRVARELSPRWIVAENVDGLLSAVCTCPGDQTCIRAGRAVACGRWSSKRAGGRKVRSFAPHVMHPVPGGACPGGCMARHGGAMGTVLGAVAELGYGFAYRVLDAQFFGVAQRRERVFIAGNLGDWAAPCQVLLEPESSDRGSAAGAEARTRVADTLAASTGRCGGQSGDSVTSRLVESWPVDVYNQTLGDDVAFTVDGQGQRGVGQAVLTVATLQGGGRRGHRVDAEAAAGGQLLVSRPVVSGGNDRHDESQMTYVAHGLNTSQQRFDSPVETLLVEAPSLVNACVTSEGADASEDGTGRGTPIIAFDMAQITSGENRVNPQPGDPAPPLMALGRPHVAGTLRSIPRPGSNSLGAAVATTLTSGVTASDANLPGRRREDDVNLVAFSNTAGDTALGLSKPGAPPVTTRHGDPGNVQTGKTVRRLTPLECERLQGFPDNWTEYGADGKRLSDSTRYRMIGNAVAVPVAEWIMRRIVAVERGDL